MSNEFTIKDGDKEIKLEIKTLALEDFENADRAYASKVASLVRESGKKKLLLRSELDKFLRDAGIWSKTDEDKIRSLRKDVEDLLDELRKGGKKLAEGRKIAISIMDKRNEVFNTMRKRQTFDDTTIESLSENEKADYIIYASVVHSETGENYWSSFEDMKSNKNSDAYKVGSGLVMQVVYGSDPDMEKRLPENKWLLKYGFIDKELNYVDRKTGRFVDKDGNEIPDATEEITKVINNFQGDIKEESPFIDDETNEPVIISV